jgi:hypothetical protein
VDREYIVRFSLVASFEFQKKQYEETVQSESHAADILSSWLKQFYANDCRRVFSPKVQFCENLGE